LRRFNGKIIFWTKFLLAKSAQEKMKLEKMLDSCKIWWIKIKIVWFSRFCKKQSHCPHLGRKLEGLGEEKINYNLLKKKLKNEKKNTYVLRFTRTDSKSDKIKILE
jgi:hypothetical protein